MSCTLLSHLRGTGLTPGQSTMILSSTCLRIKGRKKERKKEKKTGRQNPRTNGKSKAIQTESHTEAYTYTLTKREKGKKKIYIIAPKVHHLNFGMIHCLFRYSKDAGYIRLMVEI